MSVKFYYDLMSQPSRAVYLFLKCNKISFTDCPVALRKGEHLTKDYEKINPFKKVPAIEHEGMKLSESVAILRYLSRTFNVEDHWYPRNLRAQAKVDEFLEWQHVNLRFNGSMYFQSKFLIPLLKQEPVNENRLKRFAVGLKESLTSLETIFLSEGPFLGGQSNVSVADLLCICELEQPLSVGYDVYDGHPRLTDWSTRVQEKVPGYTEAHRFIRMLQKQFPLNKEQHKGKL